MSDVVNTAGVPSMRQEFLDIPYYTDEMPKSGDLEYLSERCKLDISTIPGKKDLPVVVYIHGGGMTTGQKEFPLPLLDSEYVVVAINYRLSCDRAKCPDYINDCAAAVAWVKKNIRQYGGDPDSIVLTGMSAGGYLSAMLALAPEYLRRFGLDNVRDIAAAMPVSGQMVTHFQILNERNNTNLTHPQHVEVDRFAPIYYANSASAPPLYLYVGGSETDFQGRAEDNRLLYGLLKNVRKFSDVKFYELSGYAHAEVLDPALILLKKDLNAFIAERRSKLYHHPPVKLTAEPLTVDLVGRANSADPRQTTARLAFADGKLTVKVICPEPRMDALTSGIQEWASDSVEIFVSPVPGKTIQYIAAVDGRIGKYMDTDITVLSDVQCFEDRYEINFTIPLDIALPGHIHLQIVRHRIAGEADFFSSFGPIFANANNDRNAFVTLYLF